MQRDAVDEGTDQFSGLSRVVLCEGADLMSIKA